MNTCIPERGGWTVKSLRYCYCSAADTHLVLVQEDRIDDGTLIGEWIEVESSCLLSRWIVVVIQRLPIVQQQLSGPQASSQSLRDTAWLLTSSSPGGGAPCRVSSPRETTESESTRRISSSHSQCRPRIPSPQTVSQSVKCVCSDGRSFSLDFKSIPQSRQAINLKMNGPEVQADGPLNLIQLTIRTPQLRACLLLLVPTKNRRRCINSNEGGYRWRERSSIRTPSIPTHSLK